MTNQKQPEAHQKDDEIARDIRQTSIAQGVHETASRFGSANSEFLKGYRGIDHETGQQFAKGLRDISRYKVNTNPVDAAKNIKQQAGFAAEVAATSRDNAESIIQRSNVRISRSDDLSQYGKNHRVVDRVQILNGEVIEGSQAQMKFVGDRNELFKKIANENKKGANDLSRYRGVRLELPSEQFKGAEQYCRDQADQLREKANRVQQENKPELAERFRREAENYDQLATKVTDTGLTTEEAIFYRKHPELATTLDVTRTSHRAGIEGARYGAAIGGCISLLQNGWSAIQTGKDASEVVTDVAVDTAKASAIGYSTAFVGSAIKGAMQQSGTQTIRTLANTSAPALVVNVCLSLGSSVKRYVTDEISEAQLLAEVGEKGAGMLSSGMMAALGQVAIPIPVVGAAIGGMIGYTLSSLFYQSALEAARGAELSREALQRTRAIEEAARARIAQEQAHVEAFVRKELPQLRQETQQLFSCLALPDQGADTIAAAINQYATLLGRQLEFQTIKEFEDFMKSDKPLIL